MCRSGVHCIPHVYTCSFIPAPPRRYLIHKLDALVEEPYVVVWLHTGSSYWSNCPSLAWLWRTYER